MVVGTVSTYSVLQATLGNVNKVESELNTEQEQLSSGNKSTDFTGLAAQTEQYLAVDNILAKNTQYLSDNAVVETRINTTSAALTHIISSVTSLQNLISSRLSGTSNTASFQTQLQGVWQDITTQLNSTVNNQYIFSGSKTNTPAVDATTYPTLQVDGVPDVGYYNGSNQDVSARAQDGTIITYNVRADNPAFQKLFAGLAMAQKGGAKNDPNILTQAENLVQSGLQDIISVQATVGATSAQFSSIDSNLKNQQLYWKGIQDTIGATDIVAVSTQVAINQGILQAAFQAFSKITSLRLADYLK